MLELFIEDHLVDPGTAGVSREEQRRRILFELEGPIVRQRAQNRPQAAPGPNPEQNSWAAGWTLSGAV